MSNPEINLNEILGEENVREMEDRSSGLFGHIDVMKKFESYFKADLGRAFFVEIPVQYEVQEGKIEEVKTVRTHLAHALPLKRDQTWHVLMIADGSVFLTRPGSDAYIREYKKFMGDNANGFLFNGYPSISSFSEFVRGGNVPWMEATQLGLDSDNKTESGSMQKAIRIGYQNAVRFKAEREQIKSVGRKTIVDFPGSGKI